MYNGTTVQKSVIDVDGHNCLSIIAQSNEKGVVFVFSSCKKRLSLEFFLETTSALDRLLGQLGTYATWLSSIAYLRKQLRIFIFFMPRFFL